MDNINIKDAAKLLKEQPLSIRKALGRLLQGSIITLNFSKNTAYINYYVGNNTEEVSWFDSLLITEMDYIEIDSGNLETGEKHYYSELRIKTKELKTAEIINKFNL